MSLNNLNISKKLTLGFAGVVTIVAAMCAGLFLSLQSIKTAVADNDVEVSELDDADVELQVIERQNGVARLRHHRGQVVPEVKVDEALAKTSTASWPTGSSSRRKTRPRLGHQGRGRRPSSPNRMPGDHGAPIPPHAEAAGDPAAQKGRLNKIARRAQGL